MYYYRSLRPLAALTFDLDDTLYDNHPVIRKTEQKAVAFLQKYHPRLINFQVADLYRLRRKLRKKEPEIYHDVTRWRWRAIHLALSQHGLCNTASTIGANHTMQHFALWRSQIEVPSETHTTLAALRERYPLAAITNGNADISLCGLADYFQFVLRAGLDGRAKPYQDMYQLASQRLGVVAGKILHVGDNLNTDIAGALHSGFQACWINEDHRCFIQTVQPHLLPHIVIPRLESLVTLL
ncbi:5-amino-6-(5-phospho-D-ribitylamino)uracil phosphatase YigB [Candidatus Gillettellia adelgis]